MCTISVVPNGCGARVVCNRDERRLRPVAEPPAVHDLGGVRALFPVDPQGGGTWIGVNHAALIVGLLNITPASRVPRTHFNRSRGLIVRDLLRCRTLAGAMAAARAIDVSAFAPFRAVVVDPRSILAATSDGIALRCAVRPLDRPFVFTSSSLGDVVAGPPRRRLFERMVVRNPAGWLGGQMRFHDHQWRRRPEISVRMERAEALTVSRTTIDASGAECRMGYEAPLRENGGRGCCSLL